MLQRSFPDSKLDLRAFTEARYAARRTQLQKTASTRIETTPWTIEGPSNISGRINAIAVDPNNDNVILIGAASGGIFKSTDGGTTWNPVFDDALFLAIGDITFEPGNSQVIWAGTGDPNITGYPFIGDGIYKSTDAGATWTNMGLTAQRIISRIVVDPVNPNNIYVGTMGLPFERNNNRGLYKSTDGGNSWAQSLFVANQAGIIDLQMDPTNPQVLYASSWDRIRTNQESVVSGPNAKVYKTADGGGNWAQMVGGLPTSGNFGRVNLAMDPNNPNTVYANYVGTNQQVSDIYKTTTGGTVWAPIDIQNLDPWALGGFGWYFGNIFLNPYRSTDLYLHGIDLHRTTNDGTSWNVVDPDWWIFDLHADKHDMHFFSANEYLLATDGGLYRTTDDGANWTGPALIPDAQFYRVAANPHIPGTYYGGLQDNGTVSGNAATIGNWTRLYGADGFQPAFTSNSQEMIAEWQGGGLVYSTDGGNNFNDFRNGIDPSDRTNWDAPIIVSPTNSSTQWTGTYRVYRNTQGLPSHNWQSMSGDLTDGNIFGSNFHTISTLSESPLDASLVYAGTSDGNVHRTTDGGQNWTSITTGVPKRYITSVKASPHDADEVLLTVSGYKYNEFIPHVLRSTNRGNSWTDVSGDLPQMAVNDALFMDSSDSTWVVATDGGVYVTHNWGMNWTRVGSNLPFVAVYDMDWDVPGGNLIVGTHGRSMLSFPIDSLTEPVIVGRPRPQPRAITLYPNPATEAIHVQTGTGPADWQISDIHGRQLLRGYATQPTFRVGLTHLPAGAYFLRVTREGLQETVRFVRQ